MFEVYVLESRHLEVEEIEEKIESQDISSDWVCKGEFRTEDEAYEFASNYEDDFPLIYDGSSYYY